MAMTHVLTTVEFKLAAVSVSCNTHAQKRILTRKIKTLHSNNFVTKIVYVKSNKKKKHIGSEFPVWCSQISHEYNA